MKYQKFFFQIFLWLIGFLLLGFLGSYINEYLTASGIFGDKPYPPGVIGQTTIQPTIDWGVRHYWWWVFCFCTIVLSIIRFITFIVTHSIFKN